MRRDASPSTPTRPITSRACCASGRAISCAPSTPRATHADGAPHGGRRARRAMASSRTATLAPTESLPRPDAGTGHRQGRQARGHHPHGDGARREPHRPRRHRAHHRAPRAARAGPIGSSAGGAWRGRRPSRAAARSSPTSRRPKRSPEWLAAPRAPGARRVLLGGRDGRPRRGPARRRRRAGERDRRSGGRPERRRGRPAQRRGQPRGRARAAHPARRHRRAGGAGAPAVPLRGSGRAGDDAPDPRSRPPPCPWPSPTPRSPWKPAAFDLEAIEEREVREVRAHGATPEALCAHWHQRVPLRHGGRGLRLAAHRFRRLRRRAARGRGADAATLVPPRPAARAGRAADCGARCRRSPATTCAFARSATSSSSRSRSGRSNDRVAKRTQRPV